MRAPNDAQVHGAIQPNSDRIRFHVNEHLVSALGAAKITGESEIDVKAEMDAELLLVEVQL